MNAQAGRAATKAETQGRAKPGGGVCSAEIMYFTKRNAPTENKIRSEAETCSAKKVRAEESDETRQDAAHQWVVQRFSVAAIEQNNTFPWNVWPLWGRHMKVSRLSAKSSRVNAKRRAAEMQRSEGRKKKRRKV